MKHLFPRITFNPENYDLKSKSVILWVFHKGEVNSLFDYIYHERKVTLHNESGLSGKLILPVEKEKVPVIIFLHDFVEPKRNTAENQLEIDRFKETAHFFAKKGFASLRFDKYKSEQNQGSFQEGDFQEYVAEAEAAIDFAMAQSSINEKQIILLGYGQGILLALAAYQQKCVAGMILLPGDSDPLKESITTHLSIHDALISVDCPVLEIATSLPSVNESRFAFKSKGEGEFHVVESAYFLLQSQVEEKIISEHSVYDSGVANFSVNKRILRIQHDWLHLHFL